MTRSRRGALLAGQAPPRVRHAPSRTAANDWEVVADLSAHFGIRLDEWQENVLQAAMGVRSDGLWATPQVGVSTPRQNGKSQLIVARALAGILSFEEKTIIVSAHQQDTAREVFTRLVDIIEESPHLTGKVDSIIRALNRETIRFKSGQSIRFKARSTGGGRGFSSDCLLLDEAQILGASAWSAILPTMSARPNPQVWLLGTPPTPEDDGEVFARIRAAGVSGKETRIAYLEWSSAREDDLDAEDTWAKSNPSFGTRISYDAVAGERASMSDEQFARERCGIWDEADEFEQAIPVNVWNDLAIPDEAVPLGAPARFAVSMTPERVASIAVAVPGTIDYLDLAELSRVDDSRALIDWLVQRCGRRIPVMIDSRDPAASLVPELRARGVKVNATGQADATKACGGLLDAVTEARVSHCGQPAISSALKVAKKKLVGKAGLWEWNPEDATTEAACLRAMTLAHFGLSFEKPKPTERRRVVVRT